jgi:hypothetical protein
MSELELLLWVLTGLLLAGGIVALFAASVAVVAAARLAKTAASMLSPVTTADPSAIRDVETRLADLREAPNIESGVVRAVVPEARRTGWSPFRRTPGVRFDVALPLESQNRVAAAWVPMPDHLNGETKLERVAGACGVDPAAVSDAVGRELPLRYSGDGRWVIQRPAGDPMAELETELA